MSAKLSDPARINPFFCHWHPECGCARGECSGAGMATARGRRAGLAIVLLSAAIMVCLLLLLWNAVDGFAGAAAAHDAPAGWSCLFAPSRRM